jgi:conjugative transfer signal peptidase TraF
MPRGLWRVAVDRAAPRDGDVVTVCPPDIQPIQLAARRGYIPPGLCPDGYEPLVKPVAATAGDLVVVTITGVAINGHTMRNTAPLTRDSAGRPLPALPTGPYRVPPGQVWLLSGHDPRSFDSRYFGPVPAANIRGTARSVWVMP